MLFLLAHGALGYWDEVIFVTVIVIFLGMMVASWLRSRGDGSPPADAAPLSPRDAGPEDDRFELD